jgi:hypothetical protein
MTAMRAALRCGPLAIAILASGCSDMYMPTAPTATASPVASTPPPPPGPRIPEYPPLTKPARIYVFEQELSDPVRQWTTGSRFVLYDDGTFSLQYLYSLGQHEYKGTYSEAGGVMTFQWEGWSAAGSWGAMAELRDDSLTVRYNFIMEMTDFENAIYRKEKRS